MLKAVIDFFIYLLAIYGVLSLIINIVDSVRLRGITQNSGIKIVLVIKDQEEIIEGIIRNIFIGDFLRKIMSGYKLTVLDMGSKDKTLDILEKLQDEYECLDLLTEREKEKVFAGFDD